MAVPSIGPSGKPRITNLGRPILSCACDCVTECDCTNTETATVGGWDNTVENPCGIVSCICKMTWLLTVSLDWRDPEFSDDEAQCRFIEGSFILTNENTLSSGCARSYGPFIGPPYTYPPETGGNPVECCPDTYRPSPFNQPGVCALNCPWLSVSVTCQENISGDPVVYWNATLYDYNRFDVCVLARWWTALGAGDLITTVSPGQTFDLFDWAPGGPIYVNSASITILGPVCGGDFDGDGDSDNPADPCPTPCGAILDFTFDQIGRSCSYNIINSTVAAGTCNIKWYIWSDGYKSDVPERPVWNGGGSCGRYEGLTLTLWVVMENDCVYSRTKTAPDCCQCTNPFNGDNCFEPAGTLSFEQDAVDLCKYTLCASVMPLDEACGDGAPFIEYQIQSGTGACEWRDDCECDGEIEDCVGSGCGRTLTNEECQIITLTQPAIVRWRVWDGICGCPGPWYEQVLECQTCHCCEGQLVQVKVTVSGISEGNNGPDIDCQDCEPVNKTYVMRPILDCRFWYTSVYTGEPEVACIDSSGPSSFAFGTEVLFDIECSDRGLGYRALWLSGWILAGGCTNHWGEREVLAPGNVIPMDCSGIVSGCFTAFEDVAECDFASESYCLIAGATFCWELIFA